MKRSKKQDVHKDKPMLPTAKRRNIICAQCKHPFFIRDFCQVQGALVPLLLSCGHPICEKCSELNANKICPICKTVEQKETKSNLQLNAYVMGLIGVGHGCSGNDDDPDISFQPKTGLRHRKVQDQSRCCECGMQGACRCQDCEVLYCELCYSKIHGRALQKHKKVTLPESSIINGISITLFCLKHSTELLEYFCNDCNESICPHCAVNSHNGHKIIKQEEKNTELLPEFIKAQDKVAEAMQRIHQVQKKLKTVQLFPDVLQNSEGVEASINQHFCLLHGVLQNVEKELVDKLYGQRHQLRRNLKEIVELLEMKEDMLQSGLLMAASAKEGLDKVNLKEVIEKLEDLADIPCHLVQDPVPEEDTVSLKIDESIVEAIKNHCQVHVPQAADFKLYKSEDLPEDYQMEPVDQEEVQKIIKITEPVKSPSVKAGVPVQKGKSKNKNNSELTKGSSFLAKLTFIKDPTTFYVMPMSNHNLHAEMRKNLSIMKVIEISTSSLTLSKLYAVQSSKDQRWNRARLISINVTQDDFTTCEMFFIDYGNTEKYVPLSSIQELSPKLSAIPPLIIKCSLFDIVPKDGSVWHHDARNEMYRIIKGVDRMVNILIVDIAGDTYQVEMCTNLSNDITESVSIRDFLLFLGFGSMISRETLQKTNPQSIRKYYTEVLPLDKYCPVICKCVLSPQLFYVQKADQNLQYLDKLKEHMTNYFQIEAVSEGIIHVPTVGMPCAAPYTDNKWYRCRICSIPGVQIVEVFYVDYGYKRVMRYDVIRKIPARFMSCTAQAIQVSLKDAELLDKEQKTRVVTYMQKYMCDTIINVIALGKTQHSYEVVIFLSNSINFNDVITAQDIEKSLAIMMEDRKNEEQLVVAKIGKKSKKKQHASASQRALPRALSPNSEALSSAENDPFKMAVDVVVVDSPDSIYVNDASHHQEYLKMQEEMQRYYSQTHTVPEEAWKEGDSSVVYSTLDKRYCRVKILKIMPDDTAEVFYFDMGIREIVSIEKLNFLHPKFSKTPSHVFKVKLFGILPCGGTDSWPSYSCTKLKDIISMDQSNQFFISKMADSEEDDTILVDLSIKQCKTDGPFVATKTILNSVNELLIEEGVALPDRPKMGKRKKILAVDFRKDIRERRDASDTSDFDWLLENVYNISLSSSSSRSNSPSCTDESGFISRKNVTLPPKMAGWLPATPIHEDKFIGIATYVDYEGAVYLYSKKQGKKTMAFIEKTLNQEYKNLSLKSYDRFWTVGDMCIARYHHNKLWYRGVVQKLLPNDIVEVKFVDYGNTEECEIGTLTKRIILEHIPIQCTKCYVDSLEPSGPVGKWDTEDLDRIHALTVDKDVKVKIIERYPDYNIISIHLLHPKRMDLISYLVNELHVDIKTGKSASVKSEGSKSNCESLNETDDVVIEKIITHSPIDDHKKCSMESLNSEKDVSDVVILGTLPTADSDSSDSSNNIGIEELETMSWMKINCFEDPDNDLFVASTPQDESFDNCIPQYESITIPENLRAVPVRIVHIDEFPVFFAHIKTTAPVLRKHLDAYVIMNEAMQEEAKEQPILQNIEPNVPCCAMLMGSWYRGLIIDCKSSNNSEDDKVKVRFVDFGDEKYVKPHVLRTLKEEWFKIPIICFKFRVCNIEPILSSPKLLHQKFRSALNSEILNAKIVDQYNDICDVELYVDAECQTPFNFEKILGDGLIRSKSKIITDDKTKAD